jgi:hypothetical protein
LVSKPSQLTRVTVSDPMYRCWACGQVLRLLFILPLIIALSLFIEVSVPSQAFSNKMKNKDTTLSVQFQKPIQNRRKR